MLWYKVWQESRTRFLIAALVLTGFCLFATLAHRKLGPLSSGSVISRIHELIYSGTAKGTFAVLSIFLGLGGLVRERARRTSTFTLALPVTRLQWIRTQIGMGLLQLAVLSLVPVLLLPPLSQLMHEPFPLSDTLHYSLLWFVCSSLIFAVAYLLSVVLEGEYTAAVLCYILLMLQALLASWRPLRPYRLNLMWTMAETSRMPWSRLWALALLTAAVFALAAWRTQKQDF
ncbi:MAG: ABC-2 transporter permease [Acidobacteriaceae bacterium]|nr:ABC-2 transporter permease [Acidobacteriaceae bacterium]MBV9226205.1 ABC-2 transporter permease [Acidobacteriaceae bacterium]MBV9306981.1 ABC-2 transporter permease [Acidobacteriaceae bacterium]